MWAVLIGNFALTQILPSIRFSTLYHLKGTTCSTTIISLFIQREERCGKMMWKWVEILAKSRRNSLQGTTQVLCMLRVQSPYMQHDHASWLQKQTRPAAREAKHYINKMMAKTPGIKDIQGESTIIPTLVTTPPHIPEKASHSVLATFTLSPDILTLTDWRSEVDVSFYRPRCLCKWYTLK